jgi:prevent-host-death family protein
MSVRDANQGFTRCVREVEAGEEIVITRNGTPVAKIVPMPGHRVLTPEQEAALARIQARRGEGWVIDAGSFDRDSLYEE